MSKTYGEIRFYDLEENDLIEALSRCKDELDAHGYLGCYHLGIEVCNKSGDFEEKVVDGVSTHPEDY